MIAFWTIGPVAAVVILLVALLLFGKRLPEVARSLGKGIVEFKKGVKGIEDEVDAASTNTLPPQYPQQQYNQQYNPDQQYNPNQQNPQQGYAPPAGDPKQQAAGGQPEEQRPAD